ncbi:MULTISPECIES: hypothetical protein [unclassified Lentimicrobium]|uniref:hypothetical protein n=1 Tax=unclassified Lentimicrobium TaxID=2677434 RepID=UPI0015579BF6|nr:MULTISPECIES: hypothetical protein [unclassified Lentimicrobium]NPD44791.1 hypothetical protein [Lentimicrobium sp. S6]NPD83192.1 hypothetical protein [Lentimicrobium sp. L6]
MQNKYIYKLMALLLVIGMVTTMSSCATILGGRKNTIKVNAGSPLAAKVYLDGDCIGETPFKTRIEKRKIQEGSLIEIKKDGYETLRYEVIRFPHVGYVMLDIVTGVIPLIVDVLDGNIYRPNTRNIEYELVPIARDHSNLETDSKTKNN